MFSTLNAFKFHQQFSDANSCLKYLADMKWKKPWEEKEVAHHGRSH